MPHTFHGTPRDHFAAQPSNEPYLPPDYARDGFIHCTDGADRLLATLTAYYADQPGDWVALVIDTDLLTSPMKYEDPERVFPHIYGPVNRDAIIEVRALTRAEDGAFVELEIAN